MNYSYAQTLCYLEYFKKIVATFVIIFSIFFPFLLTASGIMYRTTTLHCSSNLETIFVFTEHSKQMKTQDPTSRSLNVICMPLLNELIE